jgi:hypothetical protein
MTLTKRKGALTLLAATSMAGASLLAPTAQAEPAGPATPDAYADCGAGYVCFWNGRNGTGSMCAWSGNDPDWWGGAIQCSWADTDPPLSVFNNGRDTSFTGVVYFKPDGSRAGCTRRGQRGNINSPTPSYKVRAHIWTTGSCG